MLERLVLAAADPAVPSVGYVPMCVLIAFVLASMWIGMIANRVASRGDFLKGYFLGNRGLGVWALALTATVQSGGTFMGVPSLIYSHGWIIALWIGSYMVVPITNFGVLGKRLAQLSRRTGAVTVPDLFRARFNSPLLGVVATISILIFVSFTMFAQFKAGGILMKLVWPHTDTLAISEDFAATHDATSAEKGSGTSTAPAKKSDSKADSRYRVGLLIFSAVVVGYTLVGGFLAAVWTDLFQSVLMFLGVMILLFATLSQSGGLEKCTRESMKYTGPGYVYGPGYVASDAKIAKLAKESGVEHMFLPLSLAISYSFIWVWGGVGAPAGLVRLMASQDTQVIRKSIYVLSLYNMGIYLPLIVICICGRTLIPDLGAPDEIIPRLALTTTEKWWCGRLIAGLILAAPFGAVMSSVSSFLVVISSGLVRDVYQRIINPNATTAQLKIATNVAMIMVGLISVIVSWSPPDYLQALIVLSASGGAATFLVPTLMACYWRRSNEVGVLAAMLSGGLVVLLMYAARSFDLFPPQFIGATTGVKPLFLMGFDPLPWALMISAVAGVVVTLLTRPMEEGFLRQMFDGEAPAA